MDSIHAPTVPSGPATGASQKARENDDDPRRSLEELIQARGRVESELRALAEILQTVLPLVKRRRIFRDANYMSMAAYSMELT
jgi:hypothetical protein